MDRPSPALDDTQPTRNTKQSFGYLWGKAEGGGSGLLLVSIGRRGASGFGYDGGGDEDFVRGGALADLDLDLLLDRVLHLADLRSGGGGGADFGQVGLADMVGEVLSLADFFRVLRIQGCG